MRGAYWMCVAAAGLMTLTGAAWAQGRGGDSAAQNVRESEQYERLVCTNPAFRARRIQQECGSLQGSQMYDSCVASFQCGGAAPSGSNWRQAPASERVR